MGTVVLNGATSGSTTLQPTDAVTATLTLPSATGTIMGTGNMPAFSAYQSSSQTVSSSTYTKIQLQSKDFDTNNAFDATTNYRFQPTVAGYYIFSGGWSASNSCFLDLFIYKNGVNVRHIYSNYNSANFSAYGASGIIYLNGSTDYVEFYGYLTTTSTLSTGTTNTWFNGAMVRAA